MTHTFDSKFYINLLIQYQPKPITSEAENEVSIAIDRDLEHRTNRTPEEDTFLELLVTLIEKFEANHYPIPKSTSTSMLRHLMNARNLNEKNLVAVLGEKVIAEIFSRKKGIEATQAKVLADFFHVDVSLFRGSP